MIRARLHLLLSILKSKEVWLLGLASIVVLALAFEIPYTYRIDVGYSSDRFLIQDGLWNAEPGTDPSVRWTQAHGTFLIPALTSGAWTVALALNGWQPDGPPMLEMRAGDGQFERQTSGEWERWRENVTAPAGDFHITLDTTTFRPADAGNTDERDLGVRIDTLTLTPQGSPFRMPPMVEYVLPLALATMLSYVGLSVLRFSRRAALLGSAGVLAGFALWIVFGRTFLNAGWMGVLLLALVVGIVAILFGLDALGALYRRTGVEVSARELNWLGLIVTAILIVKLVGVFYPNFFVFDGAYHLHRLQDIERGNPFFVTRSREFQGLLTVYPPGPYLFLSPLGTLAPDDDTLLKLVTPLMEAVSGLVLFWIARRNNMSGAAACLAVLLYLAAPVAFIIFGWGVYANIYAELVFVVSLAVWFALPWTRRALLSTLLFGFCLFMGILAHASMIAMLSIFWGLMAVGDFLLLRERKRALLTIASLVVGMVIGFALYFSFFVEQVLGNLAILESRSAAASTTEFERTVGAGLADVGLGLVPVHVHTVSDWMLQSGWYIAREAWVYYGAFIVILGLVALGLMLRDKSLRELSLVLSAGFLTVIAFFLVGVFFNLYTRYMLFGAPFFALGAGYLLARLWQQRTIGRAVVVGVVALVLFWGLSFWVNRIVL